MNVTQAARHSRVTVTARHARGRSCALCFSTGQFALQSQVLLCLSAPWYTPGGGLGEKPRVPLSQVPPLPMCREPRDACPTPVLPPPYRVGKHFYCSLLAPLSSPLISAGRPAWRYGGDMRNWRPQGGGQHCGDAGDGGGSMLHPLPKKLGKKPLELSSHSKSAGRRKRRCRA